MIRERETQQSGSENHAAEAALAFRSSMAVLKGVPSGKWLWRWANTIADFPFTHPKQQTKSISTRAFNLPMHTNMQATQI